jgi:DNA topoisomerase VI subunit B
MSKRKLLRSKKPAKKKLGETMTDRLGKDAPTGPLLPPGAEEPGSNGAAENGQAAQSNGHAEPSAALRPKRRATAESMAANQRDISVSEFFAKNRHLLGFDNPRKALLTTVKEAVDNALDACEESGILPEVWVHIQSTGENRFKVGVQDNGPGILKKQIPLIFGKLLYGSKFHRMRMSRGQQGIGISAAGMHGLLTTGKPVKIVSKVSKRDPAHYYEIQIDTKRNVPEILNNRGEGLEIPSNGEAEKLIKKHDIEWIESDHGTRVTIELEARYQRGRGSVDDYLEQTAIANPHVAIHYTDPDDNQVDYARVTEQLQPEPKEIKPHPYGVELGRLVTMLKDTKAPTIAQFLVHSFSRVSPSVARRLCAAAKVSTRANPRKIGRHEADVLYQTIQQTKIPAPATDCITPIGEELILKGLRQVVPGEFYAAATRPPAVYRGNPFQIEVGLAYGGGPSVHRVPRDVLAEMLEESDARTLRQFLINSFQGLGAEASDKILAEAKVGTRISPGRLKGADVDRLHQALQSVNVNEGQSMNVLRYANRVPLQFQAGACAITQTILTTNWRSYGLSQSRGSLPAGPITVMIHMASVWVPFTNESKEAIASYPEIQKELRLALQAVGRKLGMFLRRRLKVRHEGERRSIFVRYLREVAQATGVLLEYDEKDRDALLDRLLGVAKRKTAEADAKFDDRGKRVGGEDEEDFGGSVLIISQDGSDEKTETSHHG